MRELFGGVEAGGTKFVCAIGTGPDDIRDRVRIDTTTPGETLPQVTRYFESHPDVAAVGVASFGPIETRPDHPSFGAVTTTPKPGWEGADLLAAVRKAVDVPIGFDTDVNGAAIAEARWGAGRGKRTVVYVTVGTGVGGGAVVDGKPVGSLVHTEMGHIPVRRMAGDTFDGICPFHGDCLEGMTSGPALEARWGRRGEDLGDDRAEAMAIEAHYIAAGFRSLVYVLAPDLIVLGGGVGSTPGLAAAVERELVAQMQGYAVQPEHRDGFVVAPSLGDDAGVAGAIALAMDAFSRRDAF